MNQHDTVKTRQTRTLHRTALALSLVALAAIGACSTMPASNAALDRARMQLEVARSQSSIVALAPEELARAGTALAAAEAARTRGGTLADIDHLAYLASQRVTLAQEAAAARSAQAVTASASGERDRMRLEMRTAEADVARQQLAMANQSQVRTEAELASAQRSNVRTEAELASVQQSNDVKNAQLAQASATAQLDRDRLARRNAEVSDLQAQLQELNARPTPRGMVVTLGDVLFDSGRAQLKGDGGSAMVKLAAFMQRNPQRTAAIDGYTDSVGTHAANQDLSDQRARSVKSALLQLGVVGDRLTTQAFGEDNPIGDNKTAAGRQMNRRVEIVFSSATSDLLIQK